MAEDVLVNTFMNGLDPVIQTEVFQWKQWCLEDMMDTTQLVKDKIETAWMAHRLYGKDWKSVQKPAVKNVEGLVTHMVTLHKRSHTLVWPRLALAQLEEQTSRNIPSGGGWTRSCMKEETMGCATSAANHTARDTTTRTRNCGFT